MNERCTTDEQVNGIFGVVINAWYFMLNPYQINTLSPYNESSYYQNIQMEGIFCAKWPLNSQFLTAFTN